jgi:hypothetical protein
VRHQHRGAALAGSSLLAVALRAAGTLAAEPPAVEKLRGPGAHYFAGAVRCPLAAVGSRAAELSNRIVLDDGYSRVTVDRRTHRIVFHNTHRYARRTLIGDVVLLGTGTTEKGATAPVAVHLKIDRDERRFRAALHPHPTVREKVVAVELEPFEGTSPPTCVRSDVGRKTPPPRRSRTQRTSPRTSQYNPTAFARGEPARSPIATRIVPTWHVQSACSGWPSSTCRPACVA